MGRWDDEPSTGYRDGKRLNWARIAKFVIIGGFVALAPFLAAFMIPRAGLHVEIFQRSEVIGTMQTVSVKVTNNSFETMHSVTIQYGNGAATEVGDLGPFQGRLLTPEEEDLDFETVTVTANDDAVTLVKQRSLANKSSH